LPEIEIKTSKRETGAHISYFYLNSLVGQIVYPCRGENQLLYQYVLGCEGQSFTITQRFTVVLSIQILRVMVNH
jgi:hypothetical protein